MTKGMNSRELRRFLEKQEKAREREKREKAQKKPTRPSASEMNIPSRKDGFSLVIPKENASEVMAALRRGEIPPITVVSPELMMQIAQIRQERMSNTIGFLQGLPEDERELYEHINVDNLDKGRAFFEKMPFYDEVDEIIRNGTDKDGVIRLAQALYQRYIVGKKPMAQISLMVGIFSHIICMADAIVPKEYNQRNIDCLSEVTQVVVQYVIRDIASTIGISEQLLTEISMLRNMIRFARGSMPNTDGLNAFIGMFEGTVQEVFEIEKYARGFCNQVTKECDPDLKDNAPEYRAMADELFANMKKLRRYAISESFYIDDVFATDKKAWVVLDPANLPDRSVNNAVKDALAMFVLSTKDSLTAINPEIRHEKHDTVNMRRVVFPFERQFLCVLDKSGELVTPFSVLPESLKDVFERVGAGEAYEYFRLLVVAHFYDLVVPREIAERTPSLASLMQTIAKGHVESLDTLSIFKKLIVPRTISIADPQAVEDAQQREEGKAEQEIQEHERRHNRFFGRVGHPRFIREGYEPPEFLIQEALKANVPLQPGQTFVRTKRAGENLPPIIYEQKGRGTKIL